MTGMDLAVLVAAFVVGTLAAARLTRLLVADHFPPVEAIREWYVRRTEGSGWQLLFLCHWCMAAWPSLAVLGAWYLSGVAEPLRAVWWGGCVWLAGAYVAAMVVERDEQPEED